LIQADHTPSSAKAVRKELIAKGEDASVIKENREAIDKEVICTLFQQKLNLFSRDQIGEIYEQLTAAADVSSSQSSDDVPFSRGNLPQSSPPQPLHHTVKREFKPSVKAEAKPEHTSRETDEEMARRLQREFDELNTPRARASRSAGTSKPKKPKTKKSKAIVYGEDAGEAPPKKKRAVNPDSAFNKELILR
jgi:hypothetical protein